MTFISTASPESVNPHVFDKESIVHLFLNLYSTLEVFWLQQVPSDIDPRKSSSAQAPYVTTYLCPMLAEDEETMLWIISPHYATLHVPAFYTALP